MSKPKVYDGIAHYNVDMSCKATQRALVVKADVIFICWLVL